MVLAQLETANEIPIKMVSALEQQEIVNEIPARTVSGLGTMGMGL